MESGKLKENWIILAEKPSYKIVRGEMEQD